jgi:predicted lactoylglutathione lyase
MSRLTFVNLPVSELGRSVHFFASLGFEFDASFTDEHATCMVVSDQAFVMLLVEPFFATFTRKPVADATSGTEAILGVSAQSRADVDALVDKALELGAAEAGPPHDEGAMYGRSFYDLDGHAWEVLWMDPAAVA